MAAIVPAPRPVRPAARAGSPGRRRCAARAACLPAACIRPAASRRSSARRVIECVLPAARRRTGSTGPVAAPQQLHAASSGRAGTGAAARRRRARRCAAPASSGAPTSVAQEVGRHGVHRGQVDHRIAERAQRRRVRDHLLAHALHDLLGRQRRRRGALRRGAAPRCARPSARRARPAAPAAGSAISAMPLRRRCSRPGSSASRRCRLCGWSGVCRLHSRSSTVFR